MAKASRPRPRPTFCGLRPRPNITDGRHLEKSIWRHNSDADHPITMKFGRQMQNDAPMTTYISKSKPGVEFQYGGCPFSETRISFMSAMDWDISSKLGAEIDFHLTKRMPPHKPYPEVNFRLYGRHLEKSIWLHNSAADRLITTKFDGQMQNDVRMTTRMSKLKPKIEVQYGGRPFFRNRK